MRENGDDDIIAVQASYDHCEKKYEGLLIQ